MTRINVVPPSELSRQHLLAEWRELPRVFSLAEKAWARGTPKIPAKYCLGAGHVTFFYDKLEWVTKRFYELREEMLRRNYAPAYEHPPGFSIKRQHPNDWEPDAEALALNRSRIAERLKK
jgi:deoxyribonuclease (pyrimidine dimer)